MAFEIINSGSFVIFLRVLITTIRFLLPVLHSLDHKTHLSLYLNAIQDLLLLLFIDCGTVLNGGGLPGRLQSLFD